MTQNVGEGKKADKDDPRKRSNGRKAILYTDRTVTFIFVAVAAIPPTVHPLLPLFHSGVHHSSLIVSRLTTTEVQHARLILCGASRSQVVVTLHAPQSLITIAQVFCYCHSPS